MERKNSGLSLYDIGDEKMKIIKAMPENAESIVETLFKIAEAGKEEIDGRVIEKLNIQRNSLIKKEKDALRKGTREKYIAVKGDEIIGYISYNKHKSKKYQAEITGIFVLEEYYGNGVGTRLIKKVTTELIDNGYKNMLIWADKNNEYRDFYTEIGGNALEIQEKMINGHNYTGIGYVFDDLIKTIELCDEGVLKYK
ncbi:MAG: hypothetical protein A2Y22_08035 [Clostridiales bacterium GWD2_32_59]|nr:MAG: hypothetical protein A2Y22_08035 [Clostridiales bacterium GWD2_32_59]